MLKAPLMAKSRILNMEQIAQGMDCCITNAEEFLSDAEILITSNSYPRAYVLAQFACEELGKVLILYAAATRLYSGLEVEWNKIFNQLKDHSKKTHNFVMLGQILRAFAEVNRSASRDKQIAQVALQCLASVAKVTTIINRREAAIYVQLTNTHFVRPSEVINAEEATELTMFGRLLVRFFRLHLREPSAQALEQVIISLRRHFDEIASSQPAMNEAEVGAEINRTLAARPDILRAHRRTERHAMATPRYQKSGR
jgi:AbiV family abortive infection protein